MSDFWSRRRAAVAAEEVAEAKVHEAALRAEVEAEQAEKTDEELLAELDLPDPDTLKEGDDVRGFLQDAVPERLRRRALRALWRTNPVLANVDGLVDYGQDFTDSANVVENLQTAYQVGKGMLSHLEALAAKAEAEDAPAEEEPDLLEEDDAPAAMVEVVPAPTPDPEPAPAPRRRMRFAFDAPAADPTHDRTDAA